MEEMIAECTQMMTSMNSMMGNGMMGMMGSGMMQGGMTGNSLVTPWWVLSWLLVIGLIVVMGLGIVWAVRRSGRTEQPGGDTPLVILKRRFAAGEIDTEQFEMMKHQLAES